MSDLKEENLALRALVRWLAVIVTKQQNAYLDEDCPPEARIYILLQVPRVEGLAVGRAVKRIGESWDPDQDGRQSAAALKLMVKDLPPIAKVGQEGE